MYLAFILTMLTSLFFSTVTPACHFIVLIFILIQFHFEHLFFFMVAFLRSLLIKWINNEMVLNSLEKTFPPRAEG